MTIEVTTLADLPPPANPTPRITIVTDSVAQVPRQVAQQLGIRIVHSTITVEGRTYQHGLTYETCPHCGRTLPRLLGNISRVSDIRSMQFQKVKGTIVDFNELERVLDDVKGVGSWQIELRKANDDPLDLDEIVIHIARDANITADAVEEAVRERLQADFEIRPNRVRFHTAEEMRVLQEVGVALKERKVVDHREATGKDRTEEGETLKSAGSES